MKQQGMVLVLVLIFLQILALLGLSALNSALLEWKMESLNFRGIQTENNSENALNSAIRGLAEQVPVCQIAITALHQFVIAPLSWWQTFACSGSIAAFQYYYVVEFLGESPCAVVDIKQTTANYFRITLLGTQDNIRSMQQATVVLPSGRVSSCQGATYPVNLGRQSWREVK